MGAHRARGRMGWGLTEPGAWRGVGFQSQRPGRVWAYTELGPGWGVGLYRARARVGCGLIQS